VRDPLPAAHYPGLDVDGALRNWRHVDKYQLFLRRFLADYTAPVAALDALGAAALAALVHKLAGAAGNLGLTEVSTAAKACMQVLHAGGDLPDALARLQQDIARSWESARRYLDDSAQPAAPAALAADPDHAEVAALLDQLLRILSTDNPDGTEPILARLAAALDRPQLQTLQEAIAGFHFRAAERVVQDIARAFKIAPQQEPS
jgi:HPt (histidine-containing phosphotransfer) domain-containing protein